MSANWSFNDIENNTKMTGSSQVELRPFCKERQAIPEDLFYSDLSDSSIKINPLYGDSSSEHSQFSWDFMHEPFQDLFPEKIKKKSFPHLYEKNMSESNQSGANLKRAKSPGLKSNDNNLDSEINTSVYKAKRENPVLSRRPTLDNILEENEESSEADDNRIKGSEDLLRKVVNVLEEKSEWCNDDNDYAKHEPIYSVPYDHIYSKTSKTNNSNGRKEHSSSVSSYDSVFSRDSKTEMNCNKEHIYSLPLNNMIVDIHKTNKSAKSDHGSAAEKHQHKTVCKQRVNLSKHDSTNSNNWINSSKRTVSFDETIKNHLLLPNTIYNSKYTLRYLYDGKIVSREAMARLKLNPIFQDDMDIYQSFDDAQSEYYNPRFKLKRRLSNQGVYSIYNPRFSLGDIFEQELHYFKDSYHSKQKKPEPVENKLVRIETKDQEVQVNPPENFTPGDFSLDLEGCDALIKKTLAQEKKQKLIYRSISAIVFILLLSLAFGLALGFGLSKPKN